MYLFNRGWKTPMLVGSQQKISELTGGAEAPGMKGRLMLRGTWGQRCDFHNLLLGSVTPGTSLAPEK